MPIMQLKDGTRIRFKDGVDPDVVYKKYTADRMAERQASPEYQEKVAAQQAADREEYDPTKGMSGLEKFGLGASAGVRRVGRGIGDMVGALDPEEVAARNKLDEPVLNTTPGKVGNFLGNTAALTAATAPLGAAMGAIRGGSTLANTLRAGVGNVAAQGVLGGAINADPGERGMGAAIGGALGAGTYGVLKGAGRLASGLVKLDPDAVHLQNRLKGQHIPLASAASTDDAISSAFKTASEVAEATPIAGSLIRGQRHALNNALVAQHADDLVPKSVGVNVKFTAGSTPAERELNRRAVSEVQDGIEALVGPLKRARVVVSLDKKKLWGETVGHELGKLSKADPKLFVEVQEAIDDAIGRGVPETNAERLLKAIGQLKKLRSRYGGSSNTGEGAKIDAIIASFKKLGEKRFETASKRLLPNWRKANQLFDDELWGWENFRRGMTAEGEFTPRSMAAGLEGSNTSFDIGNVPGQNLAQLGKRVLVDETSNAPGYFKTGLGLGVGATAAFGGGLPGLVALGAGAPLIASKTGQRLLSGQYGSQKALADALRNNPNLIRDIAARSTNAMTPQGQ